MIRRHNGEVRAFLGEIVAEGERKTLRGGRLAALLDQAFAIVDAETAADDRYRLTTLAQQLGVKPGMSAPAREALLASLEKVPATASLVRGPRNRRVTLR